MFIWKLLNSEDKDQMKKILSMQMNLGLLLILFSIAVIRFNADIGRFYDSIVVILIFGISFVVSGFINFRIFIEELILRFTQDE